MRASPVSEDVRRTPLLSTSDALSTISTPDTDCNPELPQVAGSTRYRNCTFASVPGADIVTVLAEVDPLSQLFEPPLLLTVTGLATPFTVQTGVPTGVLLRVNVALLAWAGA